ncbi:hypothetical protein T05_9279 [Trichinella murrelli]|uniref:Uncharacterized protein n=1 Tax=Trichinella murrelli TaxID=144512 RepID=A0A0V0SWT4_9BILA|nr:hypothetical protein T05_9279 [Trichinella murrelli]
MISVHVFNAHLFLSRLRYQRPVALLRSPQWDFKQGFFSSTAPAPPLALLPVNGDFPRRSLLVPCWPETGFKEMTLSICVRQLCKFAIDVVLRLCFGANLVVIVTPEEEQ